MNLRDWLDSGDLQPLPPTREEIARLLQLARRDSSDATVQGLSLDRRFNTAYEAAYLLCTIVLRTSGYRVRGSSAGHHWLTFALLPELMGAHIEPRATYYQACRRKRHQATYQRAGVATAAELDELLADVRTFEREVLAWLHTHHPNLISPENTAQR